MAKSVQIKRYNGSTWDEINPKTLGSLVVYNGSSSSAAGSVDGAIYALDQSKIDKTEKGAAGGVATLDSNAKVPIAQLPDSILGNLTFGGILYDDGNVPMVQFSTEGKSIVTRRLTGKTVPDRVRVDNNSTDAFDGNILQGLGWVTANNLYFVCGPNPSSSMFDPVVFAGKTFESGDWLLSIGSQWTKVDNNDAVVSVNGQVGAVVLKGKDIQMNDSDSTKLDAAINSKIAMPTGGSNGYILTKDTTAAGGVKWSASDGNTWRPIQLNGTQVLSSDTTSGSVNFKNGTGINITHSSGALTITLNRATTTTIGGVSVYKTTAADVDDNGGTEVSGRTYGLRLDNAGCGYVNVPWTDTTIIPLQKSAPTGVDAYTGRVWYEDLD